MTASDTTPLPAYLPFATFRSAVQNLRSHGLPPQLDTSAWGSRSGADKGQIWGAFQFLGLVDAKGNVQPALKALVDARENSAEEKSEIGGLIKEAYAKVFSLDLKNATPKQLADAIGEYGVQGSTRKRAVRFFIKAAQHSGTSLSSRLTANLRDRAPADEGNDAAEEDDDQAATPKANGKVRRRRRASQPPPPPPPGAKTPLSAEAMKTIKLPVVNGTLTISGTFNAFLLVGAERELVYKIIDLMTEYQQKTEATSTAA